MARAHHSKIILETLDTVCIYLEGTAISIQEALDNYHLNHIDSGDLIKDLDLYFGLEQCAYCGYWDTDCEKDDDGDPICKSCQEDD